MGYMNLGHAAFCGIRACTFGIIFERGGGLALARAAGAAGLVGAVYAGQITYIAPGDIFSLEKAVGPVVMAMIGGSGTVPRPLGGAVLIEAIREVLRLKAQYLAPTVYGLMLILVGLFIPGGLMRIRFRRRGPRRAEGSAQALRIARARRNTARSMPRVSLPVKVFCWLG